MDSYLGFDPYVRSDFSMNNNTRSTSGPPPSLGDPPTFQVFHRWVQDAQSTLRLAGPAARPEPARAQSGGDERHQYVARACAGGGAEKGLRNLWSGGHATSSEAPGWGGWVGGSDCGSRTADRAPRAPRAEHPGGDGSGGDPEPDAPTRPPPPGAAQQPAYEACTRCSKQVCGHPICSGRGFTREC